MSHPQSKSQIQLVVLQHPQEPKAPLGSAHLIPAVLPEATVRVGLSWPNLRAALRLPKEAHLDPKAWAVLYLGSGVKSVAPPAGPLVWVDKKGAPTAKPTQIDGLIVLDGTWSQAKTLWWRNAWLTKLRRVILIPAAPSLYGNQRKEPRRECVSTLEAAAQTLTALGQDPAIEARLIEAFKVFLKEKRR